MSRRVVVTGMGTVNPIGNNVEEFYDALINCKNGIDFIKNFDTEDLKVKIAAQVKNFDMLSVIETNEIRKTDLFTVYALAAAKQAMADSDILGKVMPERFGVYVGSGIGGIDTFISENNKMNTLGARRISPYFIPMMITNIASGQIAIKYNCKGACLPIVTACATGSHSIGEAYRAIKDGYLDAVIAGGTEAAINRLAIAGFSSIMALSQSVDINAASIPFDKRRNGFVMGEGSGILILEEYENAVKRGANIYAEVIGYGNTCDAYHITAPSPDGVGAGNAIKQAIENVNFNEEIYINAHGTSTHMNDKIETLAIKYALGESWAREAFISSTKSMTGHCFGAAGGIEAIAAIKTLEKGILPPTINYEQKDSECDLNYIPNQPIKKQVNVAISNSFGFGGHNACIAFKKI